MLNPSIDDVNVKNITRWSQDAIRPLDVSLEGWEFKILKAYAEKLEKNIHLVLTSKDIEGHSAFSVVSIYQAGRCRYFYSPGKDDFEIEVYLKNLFVEESDIFIGLSPEEDFLSFLFNKEGEKYLSEKKLRLRNVAYVRNLGLVRESFDINSFDTLVSLREKQGQNEKFLVAGVGKIPSMVYQTGWLGFELEKFLFKFGLHLFFHELFYNNPYQNEDMSGWSQNKYLKAEKDALLKYEQFMME